MFGSDTRVRTAADRTVMRLPHVAACLATTAYALQTEAYLPHLQEGLIVSRLRNLAPASEATELEVVDSVLEIQKGDAKSLSSMYVAAIRAAAMDQVADEKTISRLSVSICSDSRRQKLRSVDRSGQSSIDTRFYHNSTGHSWRQHISDGSRYRQ